MNNQWYNPNPYQQRNWQNQDRNNSWDQNNSMQPQAYRRITIEEAMAIAVQQVPGQVVKVEMSTERGVQVYEVDVLTAQGARYEVAVNINTGEIVEIELD